MYTYNVHLCVCIYRVRGVAADGQGTEVEVERIIVVGHSEVVVWLNCVCVYIFMKRWNGLC